MVARGPCGAPTAAATECDTQTRATGRDLPLLDRVQELIERFERGALPPDPQAAHVNHVFWLRGTCWNRIHCQQNHSGCEWFRLK